MKKTILTITILALITLAGCAQQQTNDELLILASSFPLYEFAREIAPNENIEMLIPPGTDVHHHDLRPSDLIKIDRAHLIIFTGEEMEPWLESVLDLEGKHKDKTLKATNKVKLIRAEENHHEHDNNDHDYHNHHDSHDYDDHEHDENDNHEQDHDEHEHHSHFENKTKKLLQELDAIIHDWEDNKITNEQAIQKIDEALHKEQEDHDHEHEEHEDYEEERNQIEQALHEIFHEWEDGEITLEQALNEFEETIHKHKKHNDNHKNHNDHDEHHDDHSHEHDEHDYEHDHEHDDHHHHHSEYDPHVWLDFENSIEIVNAITTRLSQLRPENAQEYRKNADNYVKELRNMHRKYQEELENCEIRYFITNHDSFRYLAQKYDLKQIPIRGLSAEQEPSPRTIANIINEAREHDIRHVFFEELASPRVSEAIAKEIGAETLMLTPAENLPARDFGQKTFLDLMNENLEALKTGLRCN